MIDAEIVSRYVASPDQAPCLTLGEFRPVDCPALLSDLLEQLPASAALQRPLTIGAFRELLRRGRPSPPPERNDFNLYAGDPVLSCDDRTLRDKYPDIHPQDVRRIRRLHIYRHLYQQYLAQAAYEKTILSITPIPQSFKPTSHADHINYIAQLHRTELEEFFFGWSLAVTVEALWLHALIFAKTGWGKSTLLAEMLYGHLRAGHGVVLIDPHGDLARKVVRWKEFMKPPYRDRLIYFDPYLCGDLEQVPVINPLESLADPLYRDSAVSTFVEVLGAVVGGDAELSTRMKTILLPCLHTLATVPGSDLHDLLDFLGDADKAAPWMARGEIALADNPALLSLLRDLGNREYQTSKTALRTRLVGLLSYKALSRCLIGKSTIDLASAINEGGKFIVFNLATGIMGDDPADTIGRLVIATLQNLAMRRQSIPEHERKSVFLVIDESDRYLVEGKAIQRVMKETRKFGLHFCASQQNVGFGMSEATFTAVTGNVNVWFVGKCKDKKSRSLAAEQAGLDAADLDSLKRGEWYLKSGEYPPVRFRSSDRLKKNRTTREEWEQLKIEQAKRHYRRIPNTGGSAGATAPSSATAATADLKHDYDY